MCNEARHFENSENAIPTIPLKHSGRIMTKPGRLIEPVNFRNGLT